jgi:hypothetical protein
MYQMACLHCLLLFSHTAAAVVCQLIIISSSDVSNKHSSS